MVEVSDWACYLVVGSCSRVSAVCAATILCGGGEVNASMCSPILLGDGRGVGLKYAF